MTTLPPLRFRSARDSAFRKELKERVEHTLASANTHRHANWVTGFKAFLIAVLAAAAFASALQATSGWRFALPYIAFLFLAMLLAMNSLHDAAHGALFKRRWPNRLAMRVVSLPIGIDTDFWTIRHVHFHHTYANVEGYDLDIEPNPFLRQTPFHAWAPQYRYQHVYWPMVAALSLPYLNWYGDWADRLGRTPVLAHSTWQGWRGWIVFLAAKAAHVALVLGLPIWALHDNGIAWPVVVACYLAGQMLASCVLVALILGTHWAEVEFFEPGDGTLPHDWYEHAFLTACDWSPRPQALDHLVGGLNYHLTHHLFPTYSHRHYRLLAPVVAEVAARHGLRYRVLGYSQLIASQQAFLKAMGRKPAAGAGAERGA